MQSTAVQAYMVYVTTSSAEEAHRIGATLVAERLAACVNVVDAMHSLYWWQERIESAAESIMLLKTVEDRLQSLMERVLALHSYDTPCVVAIPLTVVNPSYMQWLYESTRHTAE
jgi:periplasmic divalent cation tolerance protein